MTQFEKQGLQPYSPGRDGSVGNAGRRDPSPAGDVYEQLSWRGDPDPGGRTIIVPGTEKLKPNPTPTTLTDFLSRHQKQS